MSNRPGVGQQQITNEKYNRSFSTVQKKNYFEQFNNL